MGNFSIDNKFRINQHFVIHLKSIIRGQFKSQYRVERTDRNINSTGGSVDSTRQSLVLSISDSFILGVGYLF